MSTTAKVYMIDGPLMELSNKRRALVEAMARVLRDERAYYDLAVGRRTLFLSGQFESFDIAILLDDACQVAAQDEIASIMAAS